MAVLYVDLISGNDTTGNGSAGTPYLTINKAVSIAGGPHDIRVAKTTAYTSVACAGAGVGWTNNSVTVTTSADLRGSIAVGDYIGKTTAAGNGAEETFYRVNAITAATITLEYKYQGTTASEASCNKAVVITTGSAGAAACTVVARTILSGGWNLSGTPTQDGETWYKANNTRVTGTAYGVGGAVTAVTISKLNIVEVYVGVDIGTSSSVTDCTMHGYSIGIYRACLTVTDCVLSALATSAIFGATTVTNCYCYGIVGLSTMNANSVITNCKFYSTTGFVPVATWTVTGCTFAGCTTGINDTPMNFQVDDSTFINCTTGIETLGNSYSGFSAINCTFTHCAKGVYILQDNGVQLSGCTFNSCTIGVDLPNYAGSTILNECAFTTPTTYAIQRGIGTGTITCIGCTIDGASIAKAYNVTASPYSLIQYVFIGSFGKNGTIYGNASVLQDSSVYRTSAPSLAIGWVSTSTKSNLDVKVISAYVNASTERTYAFYMKASNNSWSGSITVKWKLNGVTIKTESTAITSLTTSWASFSYTCAAGLITTDGELSLEFLPNMNNYSVYVDDIVIT